MITPSYQALHEGAALTDLTGRGKIRVSGEDRARLLHAMTTNHVNDLQPGHGLYAFFLNNQGRILADVNIWNMGESFLLDTEASTAQLVFDHLDKFIIADDVTLTNETATTASISVDGPLSKTALEAAGFTVPLVNEIIEINGTAISHNQSILIFCPLNEKDAVLAKLSKAGVANASPEDLLVYHLEQQRPTYGVDFSDKHIPQETNQMRAIHFTKGCYLGQEIVERVRSRGLVNRLLVPLSIEGSVVPAAETEILSDEARVGKITSAAFSPKVGKVLAYAFVRAEIVRNPAAPLLVGEAVAQVLKNSEGNV